MLVGRVARPMPAPPVFAGPLLEDNGTFDHVILGAGLAGLSLVWYLLERNIRERVLLVDSRLEFANDRTWCFWDVESTPFNDLATHSWCRWEVSDEVGTVVSSSRRYRYLRLRAADFYQRVLERVRQSPYVTLALGTAVLSWTEGPEAVVIETDKGQVRGARVADALARRTSEPTMLQHFLGQHVRTERPVFDPTCAVLMDFRVSQTDGPHFFYVLPLAADQALVENTYLFPCEVGLERHRAEIAGYMRQRYGIDPDGFDVLDEERGAIPMTARHHPARVGRRVYPIGLAGGAARPSSGYAFLRTQRQTRHLARQLMTGRADKDPGGISGPKHRRLDEVFLRVLKARPRKAPVIFRQLFARADADSLVRFLGERSTPLDDVRVLAALPKRPFFETK